MNDATTPQINAQALFVAQAGGDHYQNGDQLQHWDVIEINRLPYTIGCATKYLARWNVKNGGKSGEQDLEKAITYVNKVKALHAAGLMKPLAWPLKITAEEFCSSQGIGPVESAAIALLFNWRKASDLDMAVRMIQTLLRAA